MDYLFDHLQCCLGCLLDLTWLSDFFRHFDISMIRIRHSVGVWENWISDRHANPRWPDFLGTTCTKAASEGVHLANQDIVREQAGRMETWLVGGGIFHQVVTCIYWGRDINDVII